MSDIVAPPSGNGSEPMLALIQRAATDPNFDILKFQSLVDAWRAERATQAHRAFNEAMARAQADMREVPKNASNDYLRARYAKLDPMLQVVLPAAQRYGLTVRFGTQPPSQPGFLCISCIVSLGDHTEVTAIEGPIQIAGASTGGRAQMTPIQAVGSTTTYLKRYILGLTFALILSDEQDDDGEALRGRGGPTPPSTPPFQAERDQRPVWTAPSQPPEPPPAPPASPPATTTQLPATTAPGTAGAAGANGQHAAGNGQAPAGTQAGNGTKRRSWADIFAAWEMAIHDATTAVQVYDVLRSDDVEKAKDALKPGMPAKERFDTIVRTGMAKARQLQKLEEERQA